MKLRTPQKVNKHANKEEEEEEETKERREDEEEEREKKIIAKLFASHCSITIARERRDTISWYYICIYNNPYVCSYVVYVHMRSRIARSLRFVGRKGSRYRSLHKYLHYRLSLKKSQMLKRKEKKIIRHLVPLKTQFSWY